MNLYCTADKLGTKTGGGVVTYNESKALEQLGPLTIWDNPGPLANGYEPWGYDDIARKNLEKAENFQLSHFYAGTFSDSIALIKSRGGSVSYTAAAHDIQLSRREHEKIGIPFNLPHLTDPDLWARYVQGYLDADVLIVPSTHSADVMRRYGRCGRIEIIPHGVSVPEAPIVPTPERFTVGYLGSFGADKGVIYLLQAWKKLNYKSAVLVLAGQDSTSQLAKHLIQTHGGGNIIQLGWVEDVSDFYNSISLYVQPSVTEGFGIEVLEALAHGRPVLCSNGAGAVDVFNHVASHASPGHHVFDACDANQLAWRIDTFHGLHHKPSYLRYRRLAECYSWSSIWEGYQKVWNSLLTGG